MLQPFRVLTPANIEQASAELVRLGERAMIYAGGAELILLLRYGMVHAEYLINIKCINGLERNPLGRSNSSNRGNCHTPPFRNRSSDSRTLAITR